MYEIVIAKVKEKEQENCAIMTTVTTCPSGWPHFVLVWFMVLSVEPLVWSGFNNYD